tara:strand:- start:2563 stop:2775 length:213 start_codon:yes stop_codon:yes gene_type:complete
MFFRDYNRKKAIVKHRKQVLLTHGHYDRIKQYQSFTAFYLGDKVFRVWRDGDITRSDALGWHEEVEQLDA